MSSSCYCCSEKSSGAAKSDMDLDSALNELGLLSTVTESRYQYLREKDRQRRREKGSNRTNSCSLVEGQDSSSTSEDLDYSLQSSSSSEPYQIIQINANFVTSLSTGPFDTSLTNSRVGDGYCAAKFNYSNLDYEAQMHRSSRIPRFSRFAKSKLSYRRFRKPYEVPWRHSLDKQMSALTIGNGATSEEPIQNHALLATPKKSKISARHNKSNASTPEKCIPSNGNKCTVTRSRSLDNLDFSKLQIAESENHNIIVQRREIDQMSDNLCGLQLNSINPL